MAPDGADDVRGIVGPSFIHLAVPDRDDDVGVIPAGSFEHLYFRPSGSRQEQREKKNPFHIDGKPCKYPAIGELEEKSVFL